jgi:hypothetical protein
MFVVWEGLMKLWRRTFTAFLFIYGNVANAYTWEFTNSGQTYGQTDTIVIMGRVFNDSSQNLLIDYQTGLLGLGFDSWTFPLSGNPGPGQYDSLYGVFGTLNNVMIPAGEYHDFTYLSFMPVSAIAPGTYSFYNAYLDLNGIREHEATGGTFTATVVPLPAAFGLLASGIALIGALGKRRYGT